MEVHITVAGRRWSTPARETWQARGFLPGPSFLKRHSFRFGRSQLYMCLPCQLGLWDHLPRHCKDPKITAPPDSPIRNYPNGRSVSLLIFSSASPPSTPVPLPISAAHLPIMSDLYSFARLPSKEVPSLLCLP